MTNSVNNRFKIYRNKARLMLGFIVLSILLSSCDSPTGTIRLDGFTMGTTYMVKGIPYPDNEVPESTVMQAQIDSLLREINRQMSTYISDSEISTFNNSVVNVPVPISKDFKEVLDLSEKINTMTSGAFDITMKPLVDAWGFGVNQPSESEWMAPDSATIARVKNQTGMKFLTISGQSIQKIKEGIELDLNAIAKGFGVDRVADLVSRWFSDYMVEIGGEVSCKGMNASGTPWIIGIESPGMENDGRTLQMTVNLKDGAMATSGDYRRFFLYKGKAYSHVIDPRTGFPAESGIASATVIAPSCAMADALATAFLVLTPDHSIEISNTIPGVEVLLMVRKGADLEIVGSAGFPANKK